LKRSSVEVKNTIPAKKSEKIWKLKGWYFVSENKYQDDGDADLSTKEAYYMAAMLKKGRL
jgi:hypothetical protein